MSDEPESPAGVQEPSSEPGHKSDEWSQEGEFFPVDSPSSTAALPRASYHYFFKNAQNSANAVTEADARAMASDFRKHKMFDEAAMAEKLAEQLARGDSAEADPEQPMSDGEEDAPLLDGNPDPRAHVAHNCFVQIIARNALCTAVLLGFVAVVVSVLACTAFPSTFEVNLKDGLKIRTGQVAREYYGMKAAEEVSKSGLLERLPGHSSRRLLASVSSAVAPPTRRVVGWRIHIIYEAKSDNIFNHQALSDIHNLESILVGLPGYNDVCLLRPDGQACVPASSAMNYFYPSINPDTNAPVLDGKGAAGNITTGIDALLKLGVYWYAGKDFTPSHPTTKYLRTDLLFGAPLEGYSSLGDRYAEQKNRYKEFANHAVNILAGAGTSHINVYYGGDGVASSQLDDALWHDLALALTSLFCVFLILWVRTNSLFLALSAVLQIVACQTLAYFIYRAIFDVEYTTILNYLGHLVAVVLVSGNVVFGCTTFSKVEIDSFELKLAFTYRKTGRVVGTSALATTLAFLTLCFSELQVVQSFGVYITSLVVINFGLTISWFPACIVIHQKYLFHYPGPHQWLFGLTNDAIVEDKAESVDPNPVHQKVDDQSPLEKPTSGSWIMGLISRIESEWLAIWNSFLLRRKWYVLSSLAILLLFSTVATGMMARASHLPNIFPSNSNSHLFGVKINDEFLTTSSCDECGGFFSDGGGIPGVGSLEAVYVHAVFQIQGAEAREFTHSGMIRAFAAAVHNVSLTTDPVSIRNVQDTAAQACSVTFSVRSYSVPRANSIMRKLVTSIADNSANGFHAAYSYAASLEPSVNTRFNPVVSILAGPMASLDKMQQLKPNPNPRPVASNSPSSGSGSGGTTAGSEELFTQLESFEYQSPPAFESSLEVFLVWGISGYSESVSVFSNPFRKEYGTTEFNQEFDLASASAQLAMRQVCVEARKSPLVEYVIRCAMEDFSEWVTQQNSTANTKHSFPVPASSFFDLISKFTAGFGVQFATDFGFDQRREQITWARARLRSRVRESLSNSDKYDAYSDWQSFKDSLNSNFTHVLTSVSQTSGGWVDVMTERAAVNGAKRALGIAFVFLLMVITNVYGSVVLALLCAATVAQAVLLTLGIMSASGWEFGIIEAICISMLAGLSLDYVLHMSDSMLSCGPLWHSWEVQEKSSRVVRVVAALKHLGLALWLAVATTVMGCFFSCFSTINMYELLAKLCVTNALSSGLFVTTFFLLAATCFGPEDLSRIWETKWVVIRAVTSVILVAISLILAYRLN